MSVELIGILTAIVAVGVTLAGVILTSSRGLRQDIGSLEVQNGPPGPPGAILAPGKSSPTQVRIRLPLNPFRYPRRLFVLS